jgi:hypothetical protein
MGWGGFLAGAAGAAANMADKWIADEMAMIREQRLEEARIRQENRANAREDVEYDRKREDTLEDYKAKKDIDLEYRQKAGIGSGGGGKESYQVMTMEDGSQRLVTKADLQRMHSQGQMGFEVSDQEGNSRFLKGALGSPRGSSSSANTLKDARLIASSIEERYGGAPNPDSDDPQEQADYEDYRLARQHIRAGLGGESGGFLASQGAAPKIEPPKQGKGTVETKSFVMKRLSRDEAVKLEREGYRLQRNPATGEIRVYKP